MSFHQEPKIWEHFWNEFRDTYFNSILNPVFATLNDVKIGFLKFSQVPHPLGNPELTIEISINISPEYRCKGLGKKILRTCIKYIENKNIYTIYAEVLHNNLISQKLFTSTGFKSIGKKNKLIQDKGKVYLIEGFIYNLKSVENYE